MTIDIDELRRLAQTVQSPAHNINERMDALHNLHYALHSGVVLGLLDRLEVAEKDIALKEKIIDALGSKLSDVAGERDALQAKIEEMEKQKPAGTLHDDGYFVWNSRCPPESNYVGCKTKLYALPGTPEGWLRAIDEALVVAHIGVANASDTYEQAKAKLDNLIGFHVDVATDPAVNGGWKLVPIEPTVKIRKAMHYAYWQSPQMPYHDGSPELWNAVYAALLAVAGNRRSTE